MSVITGPQRRHSTTLRIPEAKLDRITSLAGQHHMSRTEYMTRAALGELDDPTDVHAKLQALEKRIDWLEQLAVSA